MYGEKIANQLSLQTAMNVFPRANVWVSKPTNGFNSWYLLKYFNILTAIVLMKEHYGLYEICFLAYFHFF